MDEKKSYEGCVSTTAKKTSEFFNIVEKIETQLNVLDEQSSEIVSRVVIIKDFREPSPDEIQEPIREDCLLDKFDSLIDRLSYLNNRLDGVRIALNNYV